MVESWKLRRLLVLPAFASLLFTQATISFSTIGLFELASVLSTDNVYARIICQIKAGPTK